MQAKLLVNSPQLTVISMIRLIGYGNVSYVLPAHSEILILSMEYLLGRKENRDEYLSALGTMKNELFDITQDR